MVRAERDLLTVREIARAGLGYVEVALKVEGRFERVCAVKRPHAHLLNDRSMVELFLEEGRVAGLLRHPNVVPVLDVGIDDRGPYLLMDFVEGVSLAELIRHVARSGDLLPLSVVVQIVQQAAEGLRAAHELRAHDGSTTPLVHRDVSPQNILVGYDGVVRVADFGIAKVLGTNRPETTAILKGKTGYMAPEQLRFEGTDARADLFALGVVTYEALAAERLFDGEGVDAVARQVLHEPAPDLVGVRSDVTPALERLVISLLAKDRDHRVRSAREVLAQLDAISRELYVEDDWIDLGTYLEEELGERREAERALRAEEVTRTRGRARRPKQRRRVAMVLAGVAVVAAPLAFVLWPSQADFAPPPAEAEPPPAIAAEIKPVEVEVAPREESTGEAHAEPTEARVAEKAPSQSRRRRTRRRRRRRRPPSMETTTMMNAAPGLASEFWD